MASIRIPSMNIVLDKDDVTVEKACFEYAWSVLDDIEQAATLKGYVEATLTVNPGIAAAGMVLPIGTRLALPEFIIDDKIQLIRLWDAN